MLEHCIRVVETGVAVQPAAGRPKWTSTDWCAERASTNVGQSTVCVARTEHTLGKSQRTTPGAPSTLQNDRASSTGSVSCTRLHLCLFCYTGIVKLEISGYLGDSEHIKYYTCDAKCTPVLQHGSSTVGIVSSIAFLSLPMSVEEPKHISAHPVQHG